MNTKDEAVTLLSLCGDNTLRALQMLENQLNTLYTRAQVLLSLAGVVITVTGFSGRLIADTNRTAQVLVVAGLATVLASAAWVYARVMQIRWVTGQLQDNAVDSLETIIQWRDRKTRAYAVGGCILCAGLLLYCGAVGLMLLDPQPAVLPVR